VSNDVKCLPSFDKDGYPTEATLDVIRNWAGSYSRLLGFCAEAWRYDEFVVNLGSIWRFVTGGWSGNEEIISALHEADGGVFWAACWQKSERGGLHVFEIPKGLQ
jgi:hypothetical protein